MINIEKGRKIMKCPYCSNEMKKGEVQIGDILQAKIKCGIPVLWIPEEDCKKLLPKETVSLSNAGEGYYCEVCEKVVTIFEKEF